MLKKNQGIYVKGDDWASFITQDKNLFTGQNPASSAAVAQAMMKYKKA